MNQTTRIEITAEKNSFSSEKFFLILNGVSTIELLGFSSKRLLLCEAEVAQKEIIMITFKTSQFPEQICC